MAQQIINTGAAANDGTGDPLRTAFTETNDNFTEIYTAGPVGSNVRIANNTILTLNTNGNLVLAPNGVGVVQSNVNIVPNSSNIRNLGSATARWSTVYAQYLNITNGTTVAGDLTVGGNLTVTGNTVQIGNLITDARTLQLANTAANAAAANGSGVTVGANDDIATLLYNSTGNVWTTNIGVSAVGNVSGAYILGNLAFANGLPEQYGNANVTTLLAGFGNNTISTTGNITGGYILGNGSQLTGLPESYGNANVTTLLADLGSNVISTTGNVTASTIITNEINGPINEDVTITVVDEDEDGYAVKQVVTDGTDELSKTVLEYDRFSIYTDLTDSAHEWRFDRDTLQVTNNSIIRGFDATVTVQSMFSGTNGTASLQSVSNVNDPNVFSTFDATTTGANIKVYNGGSAGGVEHAWQFGNTGNLTLPRGGAVYETGIPFGGFEGNTIALKPSGGIDADQQLLVYPTAGADFNHLHLTSGNLYNTELFLGNDDLYVKLANTGNIVINSNNGVGNAAQWTFGANGTTVFPGSLTGSGASPAPSINGFDSINSITVSATGNITGAYIFGNGSQLTGLPATYGNANVATFLAAYGSNTISTSGNITAGNFVGNINPTSNINGTTPNVTLVAGAYNWNFDNTGNLTLPANTFSVNYANGTTVTLGGNYGNAEVATFLADYGSNTVSTTGNITSGNILTTGRISATGNIISNSQIQSSAFTGGNISWSANNQTDFQGAIKVGGSGVIKGPGGASSITLNNNGANIPILGVTNTGNSTSTTTGALIVSGGAGVAGNVYAGNVYTAGQISATGNISTAGAFVGNGVGLTNVTVSAAGNIVGTSSNVSLVAGSYTYTFDNTGILTLPTMGGDEGGEINFGIPASNTTLSTRVVMDVYQDRLRIFDGNTKGAYIDLSQASTGVGTLLNNRVSGLVNAGTFVTMDLIKATITTGGNRGLSLATTTGTLAYSIGGTYGMATPATGGSAGTGTLTTTPTASIFNWGFLSTGDTATYILTDTTNSRAYRIITQIGASFNNNMISIERLI